MNAKKIMTTGMALALLTVGAHTALAAGETSGCVEAQAMQQFTREATALKSELRAKEKEISQQGRYRDIERPGYDGPDFSVMDKLEAERNELRNRIAAVAKKYGIEPSCANL